LHYIDANIGGDISITALGTATGLSPKYISYLFVKEMHQSLHKYIDSIKLLKAMRCLKNDREKTMADIAAELGYFNERQFFKMFKKYTGKTPGQFRVEANGDERL
jgi:two-component system response regulator YesN